MTETSADRTARADRRGVRWTDFISSDSGPGQGSSKRLAGWIALGAAIVFAALDRQAAADSMMIFSGAALGISALEKIAAKGRAPDSRDRR